MLSEVEVAKVVRRVDALLGPPSEWSRWPGGWPGDIESALIDAVFSARARYRTKHGRGVLDRVKAWQVRRAEDEEPRSLEHLAKEIELVGVQRWAETFGNQQHSPGRPPTAPGGPTKAACVHQAARALLEGEPRIATADDVAKSSPQQVRARLSEVAGIGIATSNYFLMLLDRPGVKPDRMIHRFLSDALSRRVTDQQAEAIVAAAAADIGQDPRNLEHAIWWWESDRAQ